MSPSEYWSFQVTSVISKLEKLEFNWQWCFQSDLSFELVSCFQAHFLSYFHFLLQRKVISFHEIVRWRILVTKFVGDSFKMLVTVLSFWATNINYLFTKASVTNIQKMSLISKFSHEIVTNLETSTSRCHQHHCQFVRFVKILQFMMFFENFGKIKS